MARAFSLIPLISSNLKKVSPGVNTINSVGNEVSLNFLVTSYNNYFNASAKFIKEGKSDFTNISEPFLIPAKSSSFISSP